MVDALVSAVAVPEAKRRWSSGSRPSSAVVILDNCEHVLDAAAALAVRLLDAAPGLRILCTSQVPLDIDGEVVVELAPLALSDAVELFTRRATAQRVKADTSADTDSVLDLCRSLDGLPLAIELAAARTKTLSVEEITRRLDDRFLVLSDPTSRRPERRRSLRSTIRWSYDLLFPDDQRGLWALATFAGGAPCLPWSSSSKRWTCRQRPRSTWSGRLASRSLVIVDDEAIATSSGPLPAPGQHPGVRARGLGRRRAGRSCARRRTPPGSPTWPTRSTPGVRSAHQAEHLSFARTERANIDAALVWAATHDPLQALGIVNGFGWAWVVLGDSRGAQRILTALDVGR